MKLANFEYTDLKGKQSHRKVLIISTPTNKLSGIDVTEYSDEDIAEFAVEYDKLHDEFLEEVEHLKEFMDMKHNYRQFLEINIAEMTTEIL
jgi:hypothetical protein